MDESKHFPYKGPDSKTKNRYKEIFELKEPLEERPVKLIFDKIFSLIVIVSILPFFIMIVTAYFIDGLIHPQHKGSIFASYRASSCGRKFIKYKFRIAKESLIDKEARKRYDWQAYPSEYKAKNLTYVGRFLKKYYLDELPQIYNIFKGEISFVGPRALAWHHYERDIRQGNIARKILKAGLFSDSHTRKGTSYFGRPELEYAYIEKYMTYSAPALLWTDLKIIGRGIKMILEGKGY